VRKKCKQAFVACLQYYKYLDSERKKGEEAFVVGFQHLLRVLQC
jgi:hypothetical protein